jgi:proline racemase
MIKKFTCIDAHTCGNPVRLVAAGTALEGADMSEKDSISARIRLDTQRTDV